MNDKSTSNCSVVVWGIVACSLISPVVPGWAAETEFEIDGWQSLTQAERIHLAEPTDGVAAVHDRGWVVEGKPGSFRHPDGRPVWRMEDDEIVCEGIGYGFLRYASESFSDFVVSMEVQVGPGANTGIGFRTTVFDASRPRETRPSVFSYELQLQDDHGQQPSAQGSGALYGVFPPAENAIEPSGHWNSVKIACRGSRITVILNGRVVQDFDETDHADLRGKPRGGFLSLQNHGGDVRFRKLVVRRLSDGVWDPGQARSEP